MAHRLNTERLAEAVKAKRGERSLRELEPELGISFSTLSRIERGFMPDLENLMALTDWLEVPAHSFFEGGEHLKPLAEADPCLSICYQILTDESLPEDVRKMLIDAVQAGYKISARIQAERIQSGGGHSDSSAVTNA